MAHVERLESLLACYPSLLVCYSGGVYSAVVALVARRVLGRERSLAAIGISASLAEHQHRQAIAIAKHFDLNVVEITTDELSDPDYASNPTNRCYFCKRTLWSRLAALAAERGIDVVA